jgi:hypothetical protein
MQSVKLKPAAEEDIEEVWKMQVDAFSELLKKYQDFELSPAAESMDKGNLHLYEKLGYHRTGRIDKINDRMDIVYYEKE